VDTSTLKVQLLKPGFSGGNRHCRQILTQIIITKSRNRYGSHNLYCTLSHKEVEYESVGLVLNITSKFHNLFVIFNIQNVHLRIRFLMRSTTTHE
jgi:hypothetical protein